LTASAQALRLGEDLTLPLELVTRRTAVVGQTDTGKTSTAVVVVEEARKAGVQVVVIDPSGAWWGVTSSADGKRAGLDMVVMGGEHGEIPLNDSAGRAVARLTAEHGVSPVLDLDRPHFRSWAARQRFVGDYLSELYEVIRGHVLIVIDEAHRFAPQAVRDEGGDVARCLGAVVDAVALGRRRGMSVLVITQRLAKLHKDVLELCEIMFAHRLRGNNDLAQLRGWVENVGEDWKAIRAEVVGLERGVARVSAPTLGIEGVFRIRPKETFDSSRTVAPGESAIVPTAHTQADLEALRDLMADTIEEAKADDPTLLKEQIADLEREIKRLREDAVSESELREAAAEVEAAQADRNLSRGELDDIAAVLGLDPGASGRHEEVLDRVRELLDRPPVDIAKVSAAHDDVETHVADLLEAATALSKSVGGLGAEIAALPRADEEARRPPPPRRREPTEELPRVKRDPSPARAATSNGTGPDLVAGARRIVEALARYGSLTRHELQTLANTYGGSMRTNLSTLKTAGLVEETDGRAALTHKGDVYADREMGLQDAVGVPWTRDEIIAKHIGKLVAGQRRVLDVVLRSGPAGKGFTRAELERLADSRGGSFRTNLSKLKTLGLVEERSRRVHPAYLLYADKIAERRP